jgi:hypothetical protein
MPARIYDSRAFVKRLTESGMPEGQADTLASENLLLIAEHLATKDDLRALETTLLAEFAHIHAEFATKKELAQMRAEMVTKAEFNAEIGSVRNEIESLRAEFSAEFTSVRAEMSSLEYRIIGKLGALVAALLAAFAAFLKLT